MLEDIRKDAIARMTKCVQTFQADMRKLRTGRAHPSLVEHLKVCVPIGRLPGDFTVRRGNFSFYFPLATSILASLVLTLLLWLFRR